MGIESTFRSAFEGADFEVYSVSEEGVNWHVVAKDMHNHADRYVFEVDNEGIFWLTMGDRYVRLAESEDDLTDKLRSINEEGLLCFMEKSNQMTESELKYINNVRKVIREAILTEIKLQCMECGKKFSKNSPGSNTKCPKCGSYDIDLALNEVQTDMFTGSDIKAQVRKVVDAIKKIDWNYQSYRHTSSQYLKAKAHIDNVRQMIDALPTDVANRLRRKYQNTNQQGLFVDKI